MFIEAQEVFNSIASLGRSQETPPISSPLSSPLLSSPRSPSPPSKPNAHLPLQHSPSRSPRQTSLSLCPQTIDDGADSLPHTSSPPMKKRKSFELLPKIPSHETLDKMDSCEKIHKSHERLGIASNIVTQDLAQQDTFDASQSCSTVSESPSKVKFFLDSDSCQEVTLSSERIGDTSPPPILKCGSPRQPKSLSHSPKKVSMQDTLTESSAVSTQSDDRNFRKLRDSLSSDQLYGDDTGQKSSMKIER